MVRGDDGWLVCWFAGVCRMTAQAERLSIHLPDFDGWVVSMLQQRAVARLTRNDLVL
jgi:hypothetical protein